MLFVYRPEFMPKNDSLWLFTGFLCFIFFVNDFKDCTYLTSFGIIVQILGPWCGKVLMLYLTEFTFWVLNLLSDGYLVLSLRKRESLHHYYRRKAICDFIYFDSKSVDVSFVSSKRVTFAKKFCKQNHCTRYEVLFHGYYLCSCLVFCY